MISSKLLVSTVAAAAVVGVIGMAYAQTTYPAADVPRTDAATAATTTAPTTPPMTSPNAVTVTPGSPSTTAIETATPVAMPASPMTPAAPATPSDSTTSVTPMATPAPMPTPMPMNSTAPSSTDTSTLPAEPVARADRN